MSNYLYKPENFKDDTPIRERSMNEKAFIIQQIRRRSYDKKYCMEKLGFSRITWQKYRNHALHNTLPKEIGQPPRITQENAALVAQALRDNVENDKATLVTPHEGGGDITLRDMLQDAADKSNPNKIGKPLSKIVIRKFRKQFNVTRATAASRTVARAIAGADVRNAISTMIAWLSLLQLGIPFNGL